MSWLPAERETRYGHAPEVPMDWRLWLGFGLGWAALVACDDDGPSSGLDQRDGSSLGDVSGNEVGEVEVADDTEVTEVLAPGRCVVDQDCADWETPLAACEMAVCQTSVGVCVVARAPDLSECDDDDACTERSFCRAGRCESFPSDTIDCDDGDDCTTDTCDAAGRCVFSPIVGCGGGGGGGGGGAGCGDGQCDAATFESLWCPQDCGGGGGGAGCGDGQCDAATFESLWCPQDCGGGGGGGGGQASCGDQSCDPFERVTCPNDCPGACGDGVCHRGERISCGGDCAPGNPECGDGVCDALEGAGVCPDDCP